MSDPSTQHAEQVAYWNGPGGDRWAARQSRSDRMMDGIAAVLLDRAAVRAGESVLDVGCGGGPTTVVLARQVGPTGKVVALDVSAQLIASAKARLAGAANVEFILGDAATTPLSKIGADLLFSRFGVMFFGDPVAAFGNLRTAVKPGGRVTFACWRAPSENPWMTAPAAAVAQHLPPQPKLPPEAPGPFAFAKEERLRHILDRAGFTGVSLEPVDLLQDMGGGGGLDGAVAFSMEFAAAGRLLEGQPEAIRIAAKESIRAALAPYAQGDKVSLPAAIWIARATAP